MWQRQEIQALLREGLRLGESSRRERVPGVVGGGPILGTRAFENGRRVEFHDVLALARGEREDSAKASGASPCPRALLFALTAYGFYVTALGGLVAPFLAEAFGLDEAAITAVAGWIALGAFGTAALTRLADRQGRRRVLMLAFAGIAPPRSADGKSKGGVSGSDRGPFGQIHGGGASAGPNWGIQRDRAGPGRFPRMTGLIPRREGLLQPGERWEAVSPLVRGPCCDARARLLGHDTRGPPGRCCSPCSGSG